MDRGVVNNPGRPAGARFLDLLSQLSGNIDCAGFNRS